ncbi:MAG: TIM barrel protein [Bryobacteraceae bacterium]
MTRRHFLAASAAALQAQTAPTRFQLAGMTLTYAQFPFARALNGIRRAGFQYVAWGHTHMDANGKRATLLDWRDPVAKAREISKMSRDEGLTPVMMFSTVNLEAAEAAEAHARRIDQAAEAGIPFVLTFGKTERGAYENAIRTLKQAGPLARKAGLTVVVKQHGGNTATGADILKILGDVGDTGVKMCYDAGNVLDYESKDPIADIQTCWQEIRAFCVKDHRDHPKDQDCGPGYGEIDHYKLFAPVMRTGLTMPLAFENVFPPLVARSQNAEEVDGHNRRAREYVETVLAGLAAV